MSAGGFSKERLARLHDAMARQVDEKKIPGAVASVSRHGETHVDAFGTTAFDGESAMRPNAIFRIASVTKPIIAAAAMTLIEECRLRLDDPVDPWLPELADRQVLRSIESPLDDTVPANRAITVRDLLTFRHGIGLVMEFPPNYPIQTALAEFGFEPGAFLPTISADEFMRRYGSLPLLHQPGEQWTYNTGSDILGVLLARVTGSSLGEVLHQRLFEPLGMTDTGFSVPAKQLDRLPNSYIPNWETGELAVFDEIGGASRWAQPPVFESGAGGLVSTAADLLAFGQMMLSGGRFGRTRVLSRASVALMTTDHITPEQKAASPFFPGFWGNRGWGFGGSVITRRDELAGTPGRYGWDGGYGTSWYIDPAEDLVGVLLTQRVFDGPSGPTVLSDFWTSVYQAIDD